MPMYRSLYAYYRSLYAYVSLSIPIYRSLYLRNTLYFSIEFVFSCLQLIGQETNPNPPSTLNLD